METLQYIASVAGIFVVSVIGTRLLGKSTIVQLTPYDLVAIFIFGAVASEPLVTTEFKKTLIGLGALVATYLFFARLTLKQKANEFLLGEPTILVKNGKIHERNLQKTHTSLMQLLAILRTGGFPKLADVDYAILEPTGNISIVPRPGARPISMDDLDIKRPYEGLPLALVIDGRPQLGNLKLISKDEEWLRSELARRGFDRIKSIIYTSINDRGEFYIDSRERSDTYRDESGSQESGDHGGDHGRDHDGKSSTDNPKHSVALRQDSIPIVQDGTWKLEGLLKAGVDQSEVRKKLARSGIEDLKGMTVYLKVNHELRCYETKPETGGDGGHAIRPENQGKGPYSPRRTRRARRV